MESNEIKCPKCESKKYEKLYKHDTNISSLLSSRNMELAYLECNECTTKFNYKPIDRYEIWFYDERKDE